MIISTDINCANAIAPSWQEKYIKKNINYAE
jgi:hypothetical protein